MFIYPDRKAGHWLRLTHCAGSGRFWFATRAAAIAALYSIEFDLITLKPRRAHV